MSDLDMLMSVLTAAMVLPFLLAMLAIPVALGGLMVVALWKMILSPRSEQ